MLNLYDTLSRTQKSVEAMDGKSLRFYCCGPTVYAAAHIGNFRTFVVQDVFRRVVELGGLRTKHVRNITDVDDKTIRKSQEQGIPLVEYTQKWTQKFHDDCQALNCLPPHVEPGAVAHIAEQLELVQRLIDRGHAYCSEDGSVYFRISSYADYGRLAHLDSQQLDLGKTAQTRADTDEYEKDSVADFVLWKARRPEDGDNFWPSPWGEGRPGWHLECSAMSHKYLGDTFDLHSGGVDLVFPHHENEIAQSRCACGGESARHWFHVTHLLVDGAKMSKSLGNMYTLEDLQERGFSPAALRYVLAGAYYRRPLNFTLAGMKDATGALMKLSRFDDALARRAGGSAPTYRDLVKNRPELGAFAPAWASLEDDLNTPEALGHVFSALRRIKPAELSPEEAAATRRAFRFIIEALGLLLPPPVEEEVEVPADIRALAEERWAARLAKDWALADSLRSRLAELGWSMKDGRDSYQLTKN
ncbi:MAG: cysteine--tRNA ligase [Akkermansiaceae bacterium]|nr:cysteine--tRNA ligase [Akkermansiaceae bacterium]